MAQGDNFKRDGLPTMQMLRFLEELERQGNGRGSIAAIAERCGANHGSVSRYFKLCREKGILTEKLEFTGKGKIWFRGYMQLLKELPLFFRSAGVPAGEIPENVKRLIENVDYHTLAVIARYFRNQREHFSGEGGRSGNAGNPLKEILAYGNHEVFFTVFQMKQEADISMADRGFRRPAIIRHNKRGSWLELEPCEMKAWSPVEGKEMTGHLETLKYEQDGVLHLARCSKGKMRIPLDACRIRVMQGGGISASVLVITTCDVGRIHMPESTARMVFWL